MLKYGMAKQHTVNKTNQLQNASGPKQSEDKAPRKRQTDRFKMKYPLITVVQRMQVKFKRLQKWIPPLLRIGLLWQDAIPKSMAHFSEHWPNLRQILVPKMFGTTLGICKLHYITLLGFQCGIQIQHLTLLWGCARAFVRFIETKVSGLTQCFQLSSTVFAPEPPTCFVQHVHTCVDRRIRFEVLGWSIMFQNLSQSL